MALADRLEHFGGHLLGFGRILAVDVQRAGDDLRRLAHVHHPDLGRFGGSPQHVRLLSGRDELVRDRLILGLDHLLDRDVEFARQGLDALRHGGKIALRRNRPRLRHALDESDVGLIRLANGVPDLGHGAHDQLRRDHAPQRLPRHDEVLDVRLCVLQRLGIDRRLDGHRHGGHRGGHIPRRLLLRLHCKWTAELVENLTSCCRRRSGPLLRPEGAGQLGDRTGCRRRICGDVLEDLHGRGRLAIPGGHRLRRRAKAVLKTVHRAVQRRQRLQGVRGVKAELLDEFTRHGSSPP